MKGLFSIGQRDTVLAQLARPCWRKESHKSRGAAEAQMRSLLARDIQRNAATLRVYQCRHCSEWHVGNVR